MARFKLGVVGAGRWGKNLVRAFGALPEAHLSAVCDLTRPEEGLPASAEFYPSFDSFVRDAPVDAAVIATPSELHAGQAIAALERGLHVFVEKPMALTLRDAHRMRDAARASRRVLMVGHLLRYHPAVFRLKQWISSGRLGRLERVLSLRLGPGTPEALRSPWWALAPHDLSLLRYLTGGEIADVAARHGTAGAVFLVLARARCGSVTADLVVGAAHETKVRRLVVFGSKSAACFDDGPGKPTLARHEGRLEASEAVIEQLAASRPEGAGAWQSVALPAVEPLAAEAAHFAAAVLGNGRVATDGDEGCQVIAALEAGSQSLSQNGTWARVAGATADRRLWRSEPDELR